MTSLSCIPLVLNISAAKMAGFVNNMNKNVSVLVFRACFEVRDPR